MDLQKAKQEIQKNRGIETVMNLNDEAVTNKVLCPFDFKGIEHILGIPGLPVNRTIEMFGPPSSGKTTLALHMCESVQKAGGDVVYIDVEHAVDINYARNIGVDVDNVLWSQPDNGNQAIDIVMDLLKMQKADSEKPLIIVIDSVDALIPKEELEGDYDSSKSAVLGERARLMSRSMRNVTALVKQVNCLVVFINQIRKKIGVTWGSNETTSGGEALKFYSSVRLDVRHIGQYKEGDVVVGNNFKVKVVKSKIAPPFKEYTGLNIFGKGFQKEWDLWQALLDKKLLTKKGSWCQIEDIDKKFQGYNGFVKEIYNDEGYRDTIEALLG